MSHLEMGDSGDWRLGVALLKLANAQSVIFSRRLLLVLGVGVEGETLGACTSTDEMDIYNSVTYQTHKRLFRASISQTNNMIFRLCYRKNIWAIVPDDDLVHYRKTALDS